MAFTRDPELIFSKMQANNLPFYRVIDSDGKSVIDTQDDTEVSTTEAVNLLRETLESITGLVTVILSPKNLAAKGAGGVNNKDFKFSLKLGGEKNISGTETSTGLSALLQQNYDQRIAALEEKHKAEIAAIKKEAETEKRISALELKLKESKDSDITEKLLPVLAGMFGVQAPALAGTPEAQDAHITGIEELEPKARLMKAINTLISLDKDFIKNIEKLAELAKTNNFVYKMAISKLNTY